MSYILDALKKSDAEARKGLVPSIHSSHADDMQTASRPAWQSMLIGALGIALLAAVGMQMFPVRQQEAPVVTTTAKIAAAVSFARQQDPAMRASIQTAPTPVPTPPVNTVIQTQTQTKTEQITRQAAPSPPPPEPSSQALQNTQPPLRSELPVSVQQSLPPIQISGHIFDNKPQARMVFINGHIQRQGDNISPQLRLLAITPSGVELDFRGTSFRIDIFRGNAFHNNE